MASRKPIVALVCSNPRFADSDESRLLAQFLGGLLHIGGFSRVRVVNLPGPCDGVKADAPEIHEKQITIVPMEKITPTVVTESEDFLLNAPCDCLKECHVVIVCVSPPDSTRTGEMLARLIPKKDVPIGIFSLQHGCKNFDKLSAW